MNGILLTSTAAIEQRLSTYHTLTILFLAIGGMSLTVAIVQFFGFHVTKIMAVKLGIAAKRTIKEIEDANAETGSMAVTARRGARAMGRASRGGKGRMWNTSQLGGGEMSAQQERQEFLNSEGSGETSLLGISDNDSAVLSAVAPQAVNETSGLNDDVAVQIGKFTIVREIMMIHTEERI